MLLGEEYTAPDKLMERYDKCFSDDYNQLSRGDYELRTDITFSYHASTVLIARIRAINLFIQLALTRLEYIIAKDYPDPSQRHADIGNGQTFNIMSKSYTKTEQKKVKPPILAGLGFTDGLVSWQNDVTSRANFCTDLANC